MSRINLLRVPTLLVLSLGIAACGDGDAPLAVPGWLDAAFNTTAGPTITTDKDDYLPGQTVVVTGAGWLPGETVVMTLVEDPEIHEDRVLTSVADAEGAFINAEFVAEDHHFGVSFTLTAVGQTSGDTAVTTFTDGRQITTVVINGFACTTSPCAVPAANRLTVAPGGNVSLTFDVFITNSNGNQTWRGTNYRFATTAGAFLCKAEPNIASSNGSTVSATLTFAAPMVDGVYNGYFAALQDLACGGGSQPSATFVLTDAIEVVTPANTPPTVAAGGPYAGTEGTAVTLSGATATDPDAGALLTYLWGHDQGALCAFVDETVLNPQFACTDDAIATVTLTVMDGQGATVSDGATVTIANVAPTIVDIAGDETIPAGALYTSNGEFTDPGADTWATSTVDYGEGAGEQTLSLSGKTFSLEHTYATSGMFTVTVCVRDDDGGEDCESFELTVENTAPEVDAGADASIDEGDTFASSGSFTDPDANTWTATVDYGDGGGVQSLTLNLDKSFALSHTYADDGVFTVTVCVSDGSASDCDTAEVTVANVAPTVDAGADAMVDEGSPFNRNVTFTDPGTQDTWTATVDWDDGAGPQNLGAVTSGFAIGHTYADDGTFNVSVCVSDDDGGTDCDDIVVTVDNVAPTLTDLVPADGSIFPISQPVAFTGSYTDPGVLDTHTCTTTATAVDIPGVTGSTGSGAAGSCTSSLTFLQAGVYTVVYTVTDDDGGSDSAQRMIVVYDPSAGFVTGGGWIASPAGAYRPDPGLSGKATFGFVSKYQKGATTPTGNTEFVFHAGGLNFHSSNYEWLVVNQGGTNAQFKGTGRLNGQTGYGFMIWAKDGSPDTFRIKIWYGDENSPVYDNDVEQALGGGSIVIHTGGRK